MHSLKKKTLKNLKRQGMAYLRAGLVNRAYPYLSVLSKQWGLVCTRCIDAVNAAQRFERGRRFPPIERRALPTYVTDIPGHRNQRRHPEWRARSRPLWSYPEWDWDRRASIDARAFLLVADPERVRREDEQKAAAEKGFRLWEETLRQVCIEKGVGPTNWNKHAHGGRPATEVALERYAKLKQS